MNRKGVKVLQFSLDGKFMKEYPTLKQAVMETGISSVGDCCRGSQKRAGNFIFKFKRNDSTNDLQLEPKKESFILWNPSFEEMMKEKGRNYKGRDVGPFFRLCPKCRDNKTEYENYDSMLAAERREEICKRCNKNTKGKTGVFSKKCNNDCDNLIYYKRKGDYDAAMKNKTICQECLNEDLAVLYVNGGLHKYKTQEARDEINKKIVKARTDFYEKNPEVLEQLLKKISRCKKMKVHGLLCQGNAEKTYIELCIVQNKTLPIKPKGIRVPSGLYYPDFEFPDRYIEIKSTFTYDKLMEEGNRQLIKIKELSKRGKKVEIVIMKDKQIARIEII